MTLFDWLFNHRNDPMPDKRNPNIAYLRHALIIVKREHANDLFFVCQQAARYANEYQPVFMNYCGIVVEVLPGMLPCTVGQHYWDTIHGIEVARRT
jgi:hypothetical protein